MLGSGKNIKKIGKSYQMEYPGVSNTYGSPEPNSSYTAGQKKAAALGTLSTLVFTLFGFTACVDGKKMKVPREPDKSPEKTYKMDKNESEEKAIEDLNKVLKAGYSGEEKTEKSANSGSSGPNFEIIFKGRDRKKLKEIFRYTEKELSRNYTEYEIEIRKWEGGNVTYDLRGKLKGEDDWRFIDPKDW